MCTLVLRKVEITANMLSVVYKYCTVGIKLHISKLKILLMSLQKL